MPEPHETLRTDRPHSARMYDYYLGGEDWCEADRRTAEAVAEAFPHVPVLARAHRAFMHRATRTLARDFGVRQFLDVGTGIPTAPNLHQTAQQIAPESRIVYADNDPLVLEYAETLLRGAPEGGLAYVEADVRTDDLLASRRVRETLDLTSPVALSLVALMHFVADGDGPHALVRGLVDALPSGSFLVLSHGTHEFATGEEAHRGEQTYRDGGAELRSRTRAEIEPFFAGLELLAPGLVPGHRWRPDGPVHHTDAEAAFFAGVARKR